MLCGLFNFWCVLVMLNDWYGVLLIRMLGVGMVLVCI